MTTAVLPDVPLAGAQATVHGVAVRTRLLTAPRLSRLAGRDVFLKLENEQRTGSFKVRGALVAVARLDPARRARGVVTASAGNHGQGVAAAAHRFGVPARVYVPAGANAGKCAAVRRLGADLVPVPGGVQEALDAALAYAAEHGLPYVHPFDDPDVIAGQGTVGLELLDQLPDVGTVVVPVGGGGLLCGVASAVRLVRPGVLVVGVQPVEAPAFARSWHAGSPVEVAPASVADGLSVRRPGALTLRLALDLVDDLWTVPDAGIVAAMGQLGSREGLTVEPAGATGVAGLLAALSSGERLPAGPVVCVVSGGNV